MQCIGCSYCIGACPYQVRYLTLSLKWQINVISALSPDWQKLSAHLRQRLSGTRIDLWSRSSPEIQAWLQENKYYQYQLPVPGNRTCIAGSVNI